MTWSGRQGRTLPTLCVPVLLVIVAGLAACRDESGAAPGGAATVTPAASTVASATGHPCPAPEDTCAFAALLNGWILAGDGDAILARWTASEFTCPGGEPHGEGGPFPLCEGADLDEVRLGYPMVEDVHGTAVSAEQFGERVDRWAAVASRGDEIGPARFQVYSIGCLRGGSATPDRCDERFAAVLSGVIHTGQGGSFRIYLVFLVETDSATGTHRIDGLVALGGLPDYKNTLVSGGFSRSLPGELERYVYYPWPHG